MMGLKCDVCAGPIQIGCELHERGFVEWSVNSTGWSIKPDNYKPLNYNFRIVHSRCSTDGLAWHHIEHFLTKKGILRLLQLHVGRRYNLDPSLVRVITAILKQVLRSK